MGVCQALEHMRDRMNSHLICSVYLCILAFTINARSLAYLVYAQSSLLKNLPITKKNK